MSRSLVELYNKYNEIVSNPVADDREQKFRDDVTWRLSNNPDLRIQINKLCKASSNPNCYEDSISFIYKIVKDHEICRQCPKSISACPKNDQGYAYRPSLDPSGTLIEANLYPCKYETERLDTLDRISPCDKSDLVVYSEAIDILRLLSEFGKTTLSETRALIAKIKPLFTKFDELTSQPVCYVITSSNDSNYRILPEVCSYVAFQFARKNHKVAYISDKEIFQNLTSPVDMYHDSAVNRLNLAARRDVLIVEKVNELPYLSADAISQYLIPFLKERSREHRVTIFTSTDSEKPLGSLLRRFNASNLSDGKNIIRDNFKHINIEDVLN